MHKYLIKTPWWLRQIYPHFIWRKPADERAIYLSFDDGPHPIITPWVLDQLSNADALASFFCIGRNAAAHPEVMQRIREEGHAVGNHTWDHLNGWNTTESEYVANVEKAAILTSPTLMRPPYGRIRKAQAAALSNYEVVMWDVLSADFDKNFSPLQCLEHVKKHSAPGSIIVFHDSEKAFGRLEYILPRALEHFKKEGYMFKVLVGKSLKS